MSPSVAARTGNEPVRVAEDWGIKRLHEGMKWDKGLGVRFWAKGLVACIDSAVSDEGVGIHMKVAQPFQF